MQPLQLTLYVEGYFTNVWDASCFITLTEKQLEFATARALLSPGQGVPAALRAQTGIGRIPALQHGDLCLTESLAIIEYLEEVFPAPHYPSVFPADPGPRARARQVMSFLRSDLIALRQERPWQNAVYPSLPLAPLSPEARRGADELLALVDWLDGRGDLATWNIAHADLAFALMRLATAGDALSPAAQQHLDRNLARPSVRAYIERPRPPNPPPRPRS